MSSAREKAREKRRSGAMQRRNWSPNPNSAHFKAYQGWRKRSNAVIAQENFCHYWRVVLIWVPLWYLRKPALWLAATAAAVGICYLAVLFTDAAVGIGMGVATVFYLISSGMVGRQLLYELDSREFPVRKVSWLDEKSFTVKALAVMLAAPALIVLTPVVLVVALIGVVGGLQTDYQLYSKVFGWLTKPKFKHRLLGWLRPWMALPVGLGVLSVWYEWASRLFLSFVIFAGFTIAWQLLTWSADYTARRRQQAYEDNKKAETDRLLRIIFEVTQPEQKDNSEEYVCWLERFNALCRERQGSDCYGLGTVCIAMVDDADHREAIWNRFRPSEPEMSSGQLAAAPKKPSWVRRASRACGDYLSLGWSILLVKKWGICPFVTVPESSTSIEEV